MRIRLIACIVPVLGVGALCSGAAASGVPVPREVHFSPRVIPPQLRTPADKSPPAIREFVEAAHLAIVESLPDLIDGRTPPGSEDPYYDGWSCMDCLYQPPGRPGEQGLFLLDDEPRSEPDSFGSAKTKVKILPSLITFFCNPYRIDSGGDGPETVGFQKDTTPEVHLGIMGRLPEGMRVALFSTLSTFKLVDAPPWCDREEFLRDWRTHRFSFLLAYSPFPYMQVGAAGGAELVETPRSYTLELMFEARLRF